MRITKIIVENFRLLAAVEIGLEPGSTVIVGRNNSGKTSLTELFRCLLEEKSPRFRLEDFSLGVHEMFWTALQSHKAAKPEEEVRSELPSIKTTLFVNYGDSLTDLGPLSEFIIDLDPECTFARVNVIYELENGRVQSFFGDLSDDRADFFNAIKDRIPKYFRVRLEAEDPNDPTNTKDLEFSSLQTVVKGSFINAERALDGTSNAEKAVLGKILEKLFGAAASDDASPDDQLTAESLKKAVFNIQKELDTSFNSQLQGLLPTFSLFGYPGLTDPKLRTETVLKVEQLLAGHTTVNYEGIDGVHLPEAYNGLGPRNLIFILLKLFESFRLFTLQHPSPGIHLVFIEEPEAHLHPQMQAVFIAKIGEVATLFAQQYNEGFAWPVQFVVTTHSSHVANQASFDSMRYFHARSGGGDADGCSTVVKDLQVGLGGESPEDRTFLHKYMTLTRCDLLFADKCIIVEGTSERLLLPKMIEKADRAQPQERKLGSQYLSIIEGGGAYAHIFFKLVDFLNLRTLIITDIDSCDDGNKKCRVSEGTRSSNSCINNWFATPEIPKLSIAELLSKNETHKVAGYRRLAFQIPHTDGSACGRSLEDAFMLTNGVVFEIAGDAEAQERLAWEKVKGIDKTSFALKYAITEENWEVPRYIEQGLEWLAEPDPRNVSDVSHSAFSLISVPAEGMSNE